MKRAFLLSALFLMATALINLHCGGDADNGPRTQPSTLTKGGNNGGTNENGGAGAAAGENGGGSGEESGAGGSEATCPTRTISTGQACQSESLSCPSGTSACTCKKGAYGSVGANTLTWSCGAVTSGAGGRARG
jgi:hypothetical protein